VEDLEKYETDLELQLYKEYRDVLGMFRYVVETERRFYLCNQFSIEVRGEDSQVYWEIGLNDAWVWDMYRPFRFVSTVKVLTFKDVNIEEITKDSSALEQLTRELGQTEQ
jgi:predicted glutamine amidotransferase